MKLVSKAMSALVACAGLVGFAGEAHATSYKIIIDCHGLTDSWDWASTNDTITVGLQYLYGGWDLPSWDTRDIAYIHPVSAKCDQEDEIIVNTGDVETLPVSELRAITGITLTTEGSDSFYVDKVQLKTTSGQLIANWGNNNDGSGFCFSRDPEDASPYCWNGAVYTTVLFDLYGSTIYVNQ